MKNYCASFFRSVSNSAATMICAAALNAVAQTNPPPMPVVSIRASDPSASEAGDPGRFTLFRDGPTNLALNVFCVLDGTASNGVDYATIPNWIPVPAGVREVPIPVLPIDDALVEGTETVNLHLVYSPTMPPINYLIGLASNATVYLLDNDPPPTNQPPTINIVTPANGDVFIAPANILLLAGVQDPDGNAAAATVEIFAGTNKLGNAQLSDPGPLHAAAFRFYWTNVPPGEYDLSGKVTDDQGLAGWSALVHVSVRTNPPPTNQPPTVKLSSPPDGATFLSPADILICAAANDLDGYVATVEFFADTNRLGIRTNLCPICAGGPANPFCLAWSNVPPGSYVLTAKATDNLGAMSLSDPIRITVTQTPPPVVQITSPTNGAVFVAPVDLPIATDTVDADGYVTRVEFFANDHKIGEDSKLFLVAPTNGTHIGYDMVWSNPPPGLYALRAKATDAAGVSAFSEAVRISVIGTNPPPLTNFPPLVTLTAIDPIAAEGTNSWRWYTNAPGWTATSLTNFTGTNTATFLVRRSGPTNFSLTVYYDLRGSASNGVDYVGLPGVVTIPAGERSARISVVPIDDALPECTETVLLGLLVSSNSPPDYRIGWPGKAVAIIVDNDQPPPDTRRLCDGAFHFRLPAPNNANYRIESSLDMIHWVTVMSGTVTDFNIRFTEPETADFPTRFYRVVPEAGQPAE